MSKLMGKLKQKAMKKAFQAAGKTHGKGESVKFSYGNVRNVSRTRHKYCQSTRNDLKKEIEWRSNMIGKWI